MSSVESAGRQARDTAHRATNSRTFDRLARVGLACRGVLYTLIGVIALQVALGSGGGEADKSGAVTAVSDLPFGMVLLWIMTVGFAALALWQLSEALLSHGKTLDRVQSAGRAAVYILVVYTLLTMVLSGKSGSDDQKSQDVTAKLLDLPAGQFIVGLIGLGIIGLGVYWIYEAVTRKFREELDFARMSPKAGNVMEKLGIAGYSARGAIAVLAGIFVIQAAITYDPDKTHGIDATLRAFAETPVGPWLLAVIAVGVLLFGVYCFGESRWRRT